MPASEEQREAQKDFDEKYAEIRRMLDSIGTPDQCLRDDLLVAIKACGESFVRLERVDLCEDTLSKDEMYRRHVAFWGVMRCSIGLASTVRP